MLCLVSAFMVCYTVCMGSIQFHTMWLCLVALAVIAACAIVCALWRYRVKNAAVAVLAIALAVAAVSKNRSAPMNGSAVRPARTAAPGAFTNSLPFYVPEVYGYRLSDILCTTNGAVEVTAAREEWLAYDATNLTLLASPKLEDRTMWGPLVDIAFAAGATSATHTASMPVFPGFPSAFFALADGALDSDGDGIADWREAMVYGTDPNNPDTDGDGIEDAEELALGTNPSAPDTDGDGLSDLEEIGRVSVLPTFEWHDTSGFSRTYGVQPPHGIESYSGATATLLLPSGTSMLGFAFSRVVVCDNGFVSLFLPEDWVSWTFPSPPHSLAIRGFNLGTILVAPYWGPWRAEYGNSNSYICAGTLLDGTLVVEFHNVKCGFQSDDEMTYQVIVPCGAGNVVRVSYLSSDTWLDGTDAVVGVQNAIRATPAGLYNLTWEDRKRAHV